MSREELENQLSGFFRELEKTRTEDLVKFMIGASIVLAVRFDTTPESILMDAAETSPGGENWETIKNKVKAGKT